jgi:hypothetical protein
MIISTFVVLSLEFYLQFLIKTYQYTMMIHHQYDPLKITKQTTFLEFFYTSDSGYVVNYCF